MFFFGFISAHLRGGGGYTHWYICAGLQLIVTRWRWWEIDQSQARKWLKLAETETPELEAPNPDSGDYYLEANNLSSVCE